MAEDKKPQEELEFISVEPEPSASASAPVERATSAKASTSPKASDKAALYVAGNQCEKFSARFQLFDWRFVYCADSRPYGRW